MNIVQAGGDYQVFGEDVQTYKQLPAKTYTVSFHPMRGFWLTEHVNLDTNESHIYGPHEYRVDKVYRSYDLADRNFGIILSGKKGIGKSLFARMIAEKGIERDLPVIIVDTAIDGIAKFLATIQQPCVIVFDEFEKTFAKMGDDHKDPQVEMLSLFDGIDGGKKLFVITCNEPRQLNEYLINRPGRFHYHFAITCPTADEVRTYMIDALGAGHDAEIEKVIKLSSMADITYDCLRAISFDLKQGYPLEDTLSDLNINYERDVYFDVIVKLSNGWQITSYSNRLDLYSKDSARCNLHKDRDTFYLYITPSAAHSVDGQLMIPAESCQIRAGWEAFEYDMSDEDADRAREEFNKTVKVESCTLVKTFINSINKFS